MTVDRETLDAAEAAVADLMKGEWSPRDVAEVALAVLPEAIVEHATLYALSLDAVNREEAVFSAAGGLRLVMHRGDWMERGRPAKVWITAQHSLEPYTAA